MPKIYYFFAWYDLWVGLFWDQAKKRLYFCPLPCCVILFQFGFEREWTVPGIVDLSDEALKREKAMLTMERVRIAENMARAMSQHDHDLHQHYFDEAGAKLEVVNRELNIRNLAKEEGS